MPVGVVRTKRDEKLWERAKEIVRQQYKLSEKHGADFWRRVMGIFLRMKGKKVGVLLK